MKAKNLTPEEVEMVKLALQFVYDTKVETIKKNSKIMSKEEKEKALETANKFFDIQDKFENKIGGILF